MNAKNRSKGRAHSPEFKARVALGKEQDTHAPSHLPLKLLQVLGNVRKPGCFEQELTEETENQWVENKVRPVPSHLHDEKLSLHNPFILCSARFLL